MSNDADLLAERNIASAMLMQAVKDLKKPGKREKAKEWLMGESETLRMCAELIDVEVESIRRATSLILAGKIDEKTLRDAMRKAGDFK